MKHETLPHCDSFCQEYIEMIGWTYNKWFSTETWSDEFKPLVYRSIKNFILKLVYDKNLLHLRKQCYVEGEF